MVGEKIRFRFEKAGDLRLLSHHDLMRCLERMLRRARVPIRMTQGFHPAPRVVFALSLPLGVVGRNEAVELELTEPHAAEDVRARLNEQAPAGLSFTSARLIDPKACAMPRRAVYRMPLPEDRAAATGAAIDQLLADEKVWADRLKPRPRRVNIKPFLRRIAVDDERDRACLANGRREPAGGISDEVLTHDGSGSLLASHQPAHAGRSPGEVCLVFDLWVTQSGTARADELLRLLGATDVHHAGAILERAELELHDEAPPGQPDEPPSGPPETAPLEHAPAAVAGDEEPTATATWGGSPLGPVVE